MHNTPLIIRSLILLTLFISIAGHTTEPLSAETFSRLPQNRGVTLSPDGSHVAFLHNMNGYTLLTVTQLESGHSYALLKTDNERFKITWLNWANNDKVVFGALYPHSRYTIATQETRLLVIDKDGQSGAEMLIRPRKKDHYAQFQDNVIDWLPDDPVHILVSVDLNKMNRPGVYKVNVFDRSKSLYHSRSASVVDWQTDQQGRVRLGTGFVEKTGNTFTRVLNIESKKWVKLWEREALIDSPYIPLGFGLDPNKLYLRADHDGRGALFSVDTRHLDQPPVLEHSDPDYDIQGGLIYSTKTSDAIGVYHNGAEGGRIYWDPKYQALEGAIKQLYPETDNQLVSFSRDETRYLLFVSNSSTPGLYLFGDREKKSLVPLRSTYPELAGVDLPPKSLVNITMRDQLEIEAYLTLPTDDVDSKHAGPAIIFPHGGPISRDYGGFDYWTQFFVSRGIAVLQPNFRGSSGYGHNFKLQAVNNYGLGMQNDLTDSVKWMINEGIADPQRICIVGASYGGYAALTGAFKTPDLYRCAISFAGISNLVAQRDRSRFYTNRKVVKKQYGTDNQQLKDNSAYFNVNKIEVPILLVHGDKDRVVKVTQSSDLAKKLKRAKKTYEYIELENGSHYLLKQENRTALFDAMDMFLRKYLLD